MVAATTLYRSSIGKKVVMAVTGLILVGFVVAHMYGNLKVFQGAEKVNHYAEFLRTVGDPLVGYGQLLWVMRVVLLASVVLHMVAAWQLVHQNQESRPVRYRQRNNVQASYASRTMRWGGVIVLLFVIYHLLHFTTGTVHPNFVQGDVYHNAVWGFRVWYVSLFYILAMLALGMHLYHGIWSMFQTLGFNSRTYTRLLRGLAIVVAVAVVLMGISVPIAVLAGVVSA